MQRELQRGERALEPYGHILTRLCGCQFAELFLVAVGSKTVSRPCLISRLRVFPSMIAPPYGKSVHDIRSGSGDRAWNLRVASLRHMARAAAIVHRSPYPAEIGWTTHPRCDLGRCYDSLEIGV